MKLALEKGMEAMVIGAGASGVAAAQLLRSKGCAVRLLEQNRDALTQEKLAILEECGVIVLYGDISPYHLDYLDVIVVSPGIPIENIISAVYAIPKTKYPYIIGEIELAYTFTHGEPIIAITGTAGKTTTVTLIAEMLQSIGLEVFLGGNIGTPFSTYLLQGKKVDVIVLELSSFQLQGIHYFRPKVAGILNISANHLDYHKTMEEYISAKMNIVKRQTKDDFLLLPRSLAHLAQQYTIPSVIRYVDAKRHFTPQYLIGEHNAENIEFAYQASRIFGVSRKQAKDVVHSFRSLPHRLEYVTMDKGVVYINDSKSTTVDSLRVALESIEAPIILLAGGKFKGGALHTLRDIISTKVKYIVLFGGSKEIFLSALEGIAPIQYCATLQEAVIFAKKIAEHGDTVLLSPATASFDAFASYMERGETFKQSVLGGIYDM